MGGKLLDADRHTDRHMGIKKLIVSFRHFANASKNDIPFISRELYNRFQSAKVR